MAGIVKLPAGSAPSLSWPSWNLKGADGCVWLMAGDKALLWQKAAPGWDTGALHVQRPSPTDASVEFCRAGIETQHVLIQRMGGELARQAGHQPGHL